MAQYVFKLPDIGEGMTEAEIAVWHVAVGDTVAEDQPLVDLMTDKATVEIPSPVAGKVLQLHGVPGERRAVGAALAEFETGGRAAAPAEDVAPLAAAQNRPAPKSAPRAEPPPPPSSPAEPAASPAPAARVAGEKPIAAPAVRRRAWELGIPLQSVSGSGPGGRILHEDLDAHVAAGRQRGAVPVALPETATAELHGVEEIRIIGLRRRIAERLQDVQRRIPHFSYIEEVDVTALEELRTHLNADAGEHRPKLTVLPFLIRAVVRALPSHPEINAHFDDQAGVLHRHAAVHAGIATQTPAGLMVPVLRHAEARDLWDAAAEIARLAAAARSGRAIKDELSGSTITITSLGALGGLAATPVINSPEVAIVGVNKIAERPVVLGGAIMVRKMMNLSSSFDHRIVDGWVAAEFIQKVKSFLEQPATLFLTVPERPPVNRA
jgi:2-oxoisovalerate dehydrogenase E2 component (dihydrolipoyl transacylase)